MKLALVSSFLVATSAVAAAQPAVRATSGPMPAVTGGAEISIAVNNAVSSGDIGDDMTAGDVIGSSAELELQVGRRITPHLTIGHYSTLQGLLERSTGSRDVYAGSTGIEVDLHLLPHDAIDPWISLGTGLRAVLIEERAGHSILVGVELARMQLGVDFRLTEDVAIAPVIGASASLYGAHKTPMNDFEELSGKGVNWTFTAGIAGRFNAFGTHYR